MSVRRPRPPGVAVPDARMATPANSHTFLSGAVQWSDVHWRRCRSGEWRPEKFAQWAEIPRLATALAGRLWFFAICTLLINAVLGLAGDSNLFMHLFKSVSKKYLIYQYDPYDVTMSALCELS